MERHIIGNTFPKNEETVALTSENTEKKIINTYSQPATEPEKSDPYAHMFAEWDLVPPQVAIRRVRRK